MKLKTWVMNGIIAILLLCIVANFYTIYYNKQDSTQIRMPLGVTALTVTSGSMEPFFKPGDRIMIRKAYPSRLTTGDIITFKQNGRIITHRITEVHKDNQELSFTTKGDHNNTKDPTLVPSSDIIGSFVFRLTFLNFFTHGFLNGQGHYFIIAIIIVVLLLLYDFFKIRKKDL